ncbi:MAG: hypothetical protein KDI63_16400 [Gammaproteobacteria bacterium]|nr:hypothetical protein [Gammaproteobacteria bacterium]
MKSILRRRRYSRNILIEMALLAAIVGALIVWKFEFINSVYLQHQLTPTGIIINGTIVLLFGLGIVRMVWMLIHYDREEQAIAQVIDNIDQGLKPLSEVHSERIIAMRYHTLEALHKGNTPINHNALASTLVARESTRNSLPKFINNILILSGVFGTIVSLSIALLGASDLLESAVNVDGMGLVVHGMSTALSTTITAIACYVYFGYFYLKLTDAQTHLVSAVEQLTTRYFMPRFQVQTETVLLQFAGLIRSLQELIGQMRNSQESYQNLAREMQNSQSAFEDLETRIISALVDVHRTKIQPITDEINDIKSLLRLGFRLPEE